MSSGAGPAIAGNRNVVAHIVNNYLARGGSLSEEEYRAAVDAGKCPENCAFVPDVGQVEKTGEDGQAVVKGEIAGDKPLGHLVEDNKQENDVVVNQVFFHQAILPTTSRQRGQSCAPPPLPIAVE